MGKSMGQVAYEGYFQYSEGKSLISGAALPTWHDQNQLIRNAWDAAARAVREEYFRRGATLPAVENPQS